MRLLSRDTASVGERRSIDARLKKLLQTDDLNLAYFRSLYLAYRNSNGKSENYRIFDSQPAAKDTTFVYPTAIAPGELMARLPHVEYKSLRDPSHGYAKAAKQAVLWVKKMQAGTGSSMTRTSYLARMSGIAESEIRIGAKGTDLFVRLPALRPGGKDKVVSIAEVQTLQLMAEAKRGAYRRIVFHDIVSSETADSVASLWSRPSYADESRTYRQIIDDDPRMQRFQQTDQHHMPTFRDDGAVSFNRTAPGGHALFAVDALRAAYLSPMRPVTNGSPLISVIGNGEDLSSTPSPEIVGWMAKEKVAIAMVTTEKTPIDLKGGQIAMAKAPDGSVYMTIIEQAQAKKAGQLELFENLGISVTRPGQTAFFNTNMALFNYEVLAPQIKELVAKIGEEKFLEIIAPDLIMNWKEQTDKNGDVRRYLQLEGAMGSSLLRLDRYWRERFGKPLVHIVNIGKDNRTEFFSPIKSAFDYVLQFHSDRFKLDTRSMRLVNRRPGTLPMVNLKDPVTNDKYYQDVSSVLSTFQNASLIELDALNITGQVVLHEAVLRGQITIVNRGRRPADLTALARASNRFDLNEGRVVLENVSLEIDEAGRLTRVTSIRPPSATPW